jgi:hypothetical protein
MRRCLHAPVLACPSVRTGRPDSRDPWTRATLPAGAHSTCLGGTSISDEPEARRSNEVNRYTGAGERGPDRALTPIRDDGLGLLELRRPCQVGRDRFQFGRYGGGHDALRVDEAGAGTGSGNVDEALFRCSSGHENASRRRKGRQVAERESKRALRSRKTRSGGLKGDEGFPFPFTTIEYSITNKNRSGEGKERLMRARRNARGKEILIHFPLRGPPRPTWRRPFCF